jgi:putative signal transducing protein
LTIARLFHALPAAPGFCEIRRVKNSVKRAKRSKTAIPMRAILKSNDVVLLSFVQSLLADARIEFVVFDGNASVMDGSLGILPRRLMVADDDYEPARGILRDFLGAAPPEPS